MQDALLPETEGSLILPFFFLPVGHSGTMSNNFSENSISLQFGPVLMLWKNILKFCRFEDK